MAVAGLQNVSAFGPSFFGEPQSPVSRGWGDEQDRPSTRASSLLQMWREIEGDNVVSHPLRKQRNGSGSSSSSDCCSTTTSVGRGSDNGDDISEDSDEIEKQGVTGSETEHEDNHSVISEQSSDLGEIERERVRQIFREWMNSGAKGHSSNRFRAGSEWLGENECGRVRIIREWVQMSTQQRHGNQTSEVGNQIEQVRDGMVINHPEIVRQRPIRRLCGRQTLLDLLLRAQNERKRELQSLSERRPVSEFAHRNRIQALLRGRFLRNERLMPVERTSTRAATELDLIRQRHAVSDLREGFLSKLDNSSASTNAAGSEASSSGEINAESSPRCGEREVREIHTASDLDSAVETRSQQDIQVSEVQELVSRTGRDEQEVISDFGCDREGPVLNTGASEHEAITDRDRPFCRHDEQINASESLLGNRPVHSGGLIDVFNEREESSGDVNYVHEAAGHITHVERNSNEELNSLNTSSVVEEYQESVIEDSAWQYPTNVAFRDDGNGVDMGGNWPENSSNQWFHGTSGEDAAEQYHMLESHENWPAHDLQDAIDSWLEMPSGEVGSSVGRINASYFSDDDNVQSMELRELFSRRRVSSLLRSGFRESLNQVLQSHAERLGQMSGDWESDNSFSPALVEQDQEQANADQSLGAYEGADRNPSVSASTLVTLPEHLWDDEFHRTNWPLNNLNQQFGTAHQDWEVINDLRIDMARLHQRMNDMQSMLEACMEMQIELQRTVRQEVSAALNRSFLPRDADASKGSAVHDETQWDQVRKGICCLCTANKIDSLLYRCGHMCTCSKCAGNLVQQVGKCPLCRAPVVEVVRAYFVQ